MSAKSDTPRTDALVDYEIRSGQSLGESAIYDLARQLERELAQARAERDLAIAHDRQPYPTAAAYEAACRARDKWQGRAEKAEAERDAAEGALRKHGYRKSCDIPACNCGDQWNHGGNAAMRLREISDCLREAVDTNGVTLLDSVRAVISENKALRELIKSLGNGFDDEGIDAAIDLERQK